MIPKEFNYVAPTSVLDVLSALRDGGEDAKVLAGGHSLIPTMKLRLGSPSTLVDLRNVKELKELNRRDSGYDVGSMTTYHWLSTDPGMQKYCPLLAECAASVGDAQVRARGTLGGSLAHADPAADLPAAILALDATIVTSKREIYSGDFFLDLFTTALEADEIITAVRIPVQSSQAGTGSAYVKIRNKASHYALVGCAAVVTMGADGTCSTISLGITGAASKPFRLTDVEGKLKGSKLGADDVQKALEAVSDMDVDWMSDLFGSDEYRKHLTIVAASRAIETARSRA